MKLAWTSTLALLLLFWTPAPARAAPEAAPAEEDGGETQAAGQLRQESLFSDAGSRDPWRGSQIVLRNTLSALTLDPGAEQTYNEYFAMTWSFRPWWWVSDRVFLRAQLDLTHELTESDVTTDAGEALLGDLALVAGGSGLYTIPVLGVGISTDLVLTLPTSKASQGRTLMVGIGPGLGLSRSFGLLQGLVLGYNLRVTGRLFWYNTAERESPMVPGCSSGPAGCEAYLNTGVRNPYLRLSQVGYVSLKALSWLGITLSVGHAIDWLHDLEPDANVTYQAVDDANRRYLTFLELAVSFRPLEMLEVGVGYSALHPQLAPDSTYYTPFFNRYSALLLDIKLHADALVSSIRRIAQ